MKYLSALIILSLSLQSFACSCAMQPRDFDRAVTRAYENAAAVVLAQVVSIVEEEVPADWNSDDALHEGQTTHFSTLKSWKGTHGKQFYTQVVTACCMCGASFEQGETYLLYLYGPNKNGYYSTSICSRTKPFEKAEEEINFLRKFAPNRGVGDDSHQR